MKDNYVIFITEHDVLKGNLPLYTIDRFIKENGEAFNDGSHIIYVNASHRDASTALGRLMHDMFDSVWDEIRDLVVEEVREDERKNLVTTMLKAGDLTLERIVQYSGLPLRSVKAIARSLGITPPTA